MKRFLCSLACAVSVSLSAQAVPYLISGTIQIQAPTTKDFSIDFDLDGATHSFLWDGFSNPTPSLTAVTITDTVSQITPLDYTFGWTQDVVGGLFGFDLNLSQNVSGVGPGQVFFTGDTPSTTASRTCLPLNNPFSFTGGGLDPFAFSISGAVAVPELSPHGAWLPLAFTSLLLLSAGKRRAAQA